MSSEKSVLPVPPSLPHSLLIAGKTEEAWLISFKFWMWWTYIIQNAISLLGPNQAFNKVWTQSKAQPQGTVPMATRPVCRHKQSREGWKKAGGCSNSLRDWMGNFIILHIMLMESF